LDFGFWILDFGLRIESSRLLQNILSIEAILGLLSGIVDELTFKRRTKHFALIVLRLVETLPRKRSAETIGRQLIRSATSVGANYRAACRGRSTADVISKLAVVEEEADESLYWMELLVESGITPKEKVENLMSEANEILAMTVASIKTLKSSRELSISNPKSKIQNPKSGQSS
jgi:four helix bundle protein